MNAPPTATLRQLHGRPHQPLDWPAANTPVLLNRKLNPAAHPVAVSVFADEVWDLTAGLFESHARTTRLPFAAVPARFREQVKHYIWQIINHPPAQPLRSTRGTRLALRSISLTLPRLTTFVAWLDSHAIDGFDQVTPGHLDRYLNDVTITEATVNMKASLLVEVRRLWSYRGRLPEPMRLPSQIPWGGQEPRDLLGGAVRPRENRTPRINSDTIDLLLMWSLRFVEDYADDIITAHHEYLALFPRSPHIRTPATRGARRRIDDVIPDVIAYLNRLAAAGQPLPGRRRPDGTLGVDWPHLVRIFNSSETAFHRSDRLRPLIENSGLPIADAAHLDSRITGQLDGRPWRATRITYDEAPEMAGLLRTACLIVIAYLSGMRTGEVLNLQRGCLSHDPVTGIWSISGRKFKGARDANGDKIPEGQLRDDPWVVVAQASHAVRVLERLHEQPLLFPARLHPHRPDEGRSRQGQARGAAQVPHDIADLTRWVQSYCQATDRGHEVIPPDPHGLISPARFRRTLAWHIVRRPRGLIAGAIQYGHVHIQITLGYSGANDSGFPDEHAYEDWLQRLDRLAEDHHQLMSGEHHSGPAAATYRHRINTAHHQFAGRVLPTLAQARDLLANPLLQIYPGKAMTCVFDAAKALCQQRRTHDDTHTTPDHDDCRTNCQNIAHTDRDITQLRSRAADLQTIVGDHLAPSPRHHRQRAELDRLRQIIRTHEKQQ